MYNYFFSIPVYRFTEHDFDSKVQILRNGSFELHDGTLMYDRGKSYSWQFNEIVGWLRLYFHFSCLQVDLWFYKHKRRNWIIEIKKKNFIGQGRLTEFMLSDLSDAALSTDETIARIQASVNNNENLRRYFIDFSEFRQMGYALNWKMVKESSNAIRRNKDKLV